MTKRKDYMAVLCIVLMVVCAVPGIMAMNFSSSYEVFNQYGQKVMLFGYGIYAHDSYLQAVNSIGTDISIVFVMVPLFIVTYLRYRKRQDAASELNLIAVYGVVLYYAASIAFGLAYNRLFIAYLLLFSCSLFGMFVHIRRIQWEKCIESTKGLQIFLIISGTALIVAWLPDVIPTVITDQPLSIIAVYTTIITYVLDMGIISPLLFLSGYLIRKKDALGTVLLAILLKLCVVIGVMMVTQTACQIIAQIDLPFIVFLTKSGSFLLLSGFAYYFERKIYKKV